MNKKEVVQIILISAEKKLNFFKLIKPGNLERVEI